MESRKSVRWTSQECEVIAKYYKSHGVEYCMSLLPGRAKSHIRQKAMFIGYAKKKVASTFDDFKAKIRVTPGCWIWNGVVLSNGYGQFTMKGKRYGAHRFSYSAYIGKIEDGIFICHKCDNPICVNPDHLFPGTPLENMRDKIKKGRQAVGENANRGHLKAQDVLAIRSSQSSTKEEAEKYGISTANVKSIRARKIWKHL